MMLHSFRPGIYPTGTYYNYHLMLGYNFRPNKLGNKLRGHSNTHAHTPSARLDKVDKELEVEGVAVEVGSLVHFP